VFCNAVTPRRARLGEQASPPLSTELIEAARSGDQRASQVLWKRCSAVARQVARRSAGRGIDADDLSQEALLRAVESFSSLRDPSALVNWLQVVVRRSAVHDARRVRRKRPLLSGGDDPSVLPSLEALPDFQVDVRLLIGLLQGLSEEERRCLWLRRGEGWRIEEIAQETALSISTIHRRVRTAERRLIKRLRG
jgi:RNA polymerase sigma-70 factor, ECF subfamily